MLDIARALLGLMAWMPIAVLAVTPLPDGDFESGALSGWTASARNGGVAGVATEGNCFSSFDTSGLVLAGNHAGLLRSNRPADADSTALLTSAPFSAGIGVAFSALTETIDAGRVPDMPVHFTVRILDAESGTELSATALATAVVALSGDCYQHPVNGAFHTHFIDTRAHLGRAVRIQFSQSSKVRHAGLFTLVDDVVRLDAEDAQVLPDRPRAVAGVSRSGDGRLRLDASLSTDPARMPLTHAWRIAGEGADRAGEFPCIDDLEPGRYQATLVVDNGLYENADTVDFVVREPRQDDDQDDDDTDGDGDGDVDDGNGDDDAGEGLSAEAGFGGDCGDGDDADRSRATAGESRDFRHFNPSAWDDQGVAIVMCHWTNGMDGCTLNGEPMALHPNQSLGRDVWADYDGPTGQNGTIECSRDGERFVFQVSATTELEYGTCRPGSGL